MQVAPQPAAFLLARRDDRHARPAQVGGQPDPTHGEAERADQLLEDLAIAGPDRWSVGPADDQPPDDVVAMAEQDLAMVCGLGTDRRRPLPATGSARGRWPRSRGGAPARDWSREPGAGRRPCRCRRDRRRVARRRAGRRERRTRGGRRGAGSGVAWARRSARSRRSWRRATTSDRSCRTGSRARRRDPCTRARSRPPSAPTPGPDAMSARDPTTSAGQPRPAPRRRATAPSPAAGAPTRRRAPRSVQSTRSRLDGTIASHAGDRAHEEPTIERIAVRATIAPPVTAEQNDSDRGRRWRSARSRSRRRRAARCAGRSPSR